MKLWMKVLIVTLLVATPAFLIGPVLFPPADVDSEPSAAQIPFFIFLGAADAILLGLGVSFLVFGFPVLEQKSTVEESDGRAHAPLRPLPACALTSSRLLVLQPRLKLPLIPSDKPLTVNRDAFEMATRRAPPGSQGPLVGALSRHRPQMVVAVLVVATLLGGAFYAARFSEGAPRVVYTASLEEAQSDSRNSLQVNINTADAEELDELPQVGPATAEAIIEHRSANGLFRSVEDLEEVSGIGPSTVEEIKPFATV